MGSNWGTGARVLVGFDGFSWSGREDWGVIRGRRLQPFLGGVCTAKPERGFWSTEVMVFG